MSLYRDVRIRAIRMANNDGSNPTAITPANIVTWVTTANKVFAPAGIRLLFDPASDFETRNDTRLNQLVGDSGLQPDVDAIATADAIANESPNRIVVICRTPRTGVKGAGGGFAGYPERRVVMGAFDPNGTTLFAHELGHYFGLPHTFRHVVETTAKAELLFATLGNDLAALDEDAGLVSDTPPEMIISDQNAGTNTSIVFAGKTIQFLRSNVMSYYRPLTPEAKTITPGQAQRMLAILEARREAIVAHPKQIEVTGTGEEGEPSGVTVRTGDKFSIRASGLLAVSTPPHGYGSGGFPPDGDGKLAQPGGAYPFVAHGLLGFSLIYKIGPSDAWHQGRSTLDVTAHRDGALLFAVNQYSGRFQDYGNAHARSWTVNLQYPGLMVDVWQDDWRWCHKCDGLFYSGGQSDVGRCPAGAQHETGTSGNYSVAHGTPHFIGQHNWRWCNKCRGLFYSGGLSPAGKCPAGDSHEQGMSGDYTLAHNALNVAGQDEWRFCSKCFGLFFASGHPSAGVCPGLGQHETGSSGNYTVSHAPA